MPTPGNTPTPAEWFSSTCPDPQLPRQTPNLSASSSMAFQQEDSPVFSTAASQSSLGSSSLMAAASQTGSTLDPAASQKSMKGTHTSTPAPTIPARHPRRTQAVDLDERMDLDLDVPLPPAPLVINTRNPVRSTSPMDIPSLIEQSFTSTTESSHGQMNPPTQVGPTNTHVSSIHSETTCSLRPKSAPPGRQNNLTDRIQVFEAPQSQQPRLLPLSAASLPFVVAPLVPPRPKLYSEEIARSLSNRGTKTAGAAERASTSASFNELQDTMARIQKSKSPIQENTSFYKGAVIGEPTNADTSVIQTNTSGRQYHSHGHPEGATNIMNKVQQIPSGIVSSFSSRHNFNLMNELKATRGFQNTTGTTTSLNNLGNNNNPANTNPRANIRSTSMNLPQHQSTKPKVPVVAPPPSMPDSQPSQPSPPLPPNLEKYKDQEQPPIFPPANPPPRAILNPKTKTVEVLDFENSFYPTEIDSDYYGPGPDESSSSTENADYGNNGFGGVGAMDGDYDDDMMKYHMSQADLSLSFLPHAPDPRSRSVKKRAERDEKRARKRQMREDSRMLGKALSSLSKMAVDTENLWKLRGGVAAARQNKAWSDTSDEEDSDDTTNASTRTNVSSTNAAVAKKASRRRNRKQGEKIDELDREDEDYDDEYEGGGGGCDGHDSEAAFQVINRARRRLKCMDHIIKDGLQQVHKWETGVLLAAGAGVKRKYGNEGSFRDEEGDGVDDPGMGNEVVERGRKEKKGKWDGGSERSRARMKYGAPVITREVSMDL
ncbi:hypothetical protein DFH27DRAFT_558126 [Peziza echinospora]|nr:hypothetical protein DFH27DRAFT_558126 [Peziza echinospora]